MSEKTPAPSPFYEGTHIQFAWDNTSLSEYLKCPRRYLYSIIMGYRGRKRAAHFSFGGYLHRGLELYDRFRAQGQDHETATKEAIKKISEESQMVVQEVNPGTLIMEEKKLPYNTDDNRRNLFTLIRSMVWYLEQFKNDVFTTHILPDGKPAVELSFRVPLFDDVLYCGHVDRVVDFQGAVWGLERKHTVRKIGTFYFDEFMMANQVSGYTFALMTSFRERVGGFIIDAAQIAVNFTRFERGFSPRTKRQIEEWVGNTHYFIEQAMENARHYTDTQDESCFPMNVGSCYSKYGPCPFVGVCGVDPSVRKAHLDTDFAVQKWNPLENRGDDEE